MGILFFLHRDGLTKTFTFEFWVTDYVLLADYGPFANTYDMFSYIISP